MAKQVHVSVTNDMSTDQRVDKVCRSLMGAGYELRVTCRRLPDSMPIERPYAVNRMKLWFSRGPMFYLEFNWRLWRQLMKHPADILLANDLDTLLANYMASVLKKNCSLVYDSHEYFTEVPELQGRWARRVWLAIEKFIFPRLKYVYTVNSYIADIYQEAYDVPVHVIRNMPDTRVLRVWRSRKELGLAIDKKILILQGAGINVDRGAEEAVLAMEHLPDDYLLLIIGAGDVISELKSMVHKKGLELKVMFKPRMPYDQLMQHTACADIGLSLDKPGCGNYDLSLPNKLFDALSAGLPVLVGPTKVVAELVSTQQLGIVLDEVRPDLIAKAAQSLMNNTPAYAAYASRALEASKQLNWEHEERELLKIYGNIEG